MSDRRRSKLHEGMRKLVLAVSLVAALQASAVRGEAVAGKPPPFTPMRYNEDYSYLRDPSLRSGAWWERLKYLPLDSRGWAWLSLGDEIRFRYERYWKPQERALERHPLQDRAPGHPQPLLAVLGEVGEVERIPGAGRG